MQFPSRRARVALLAGVGAIAVAAPASAAPTSDFDAATGKLTIGFTADEDVAVTVDGAGKVAVNGGATTTDADDVRSLEVREAADGTDVNEIDLSAVTAADFPQLASTLVRAEGGNDVITGTQLADRIEGGRQNDVMRGADGDDTLVWNNGEGTDDMFGGDGIDTIENNGADTGSAVRGAMIDVWFPSCSQALAWGRRVVTITLL